MTVDNSERKTSSSNPTVEIDKFGRKLVNFKPAVKAAIRITNADVKPGGEYWFLKKVWYMDNNNDPKKPNYNGGRHNIYFQEPHFKHSSPKMAVLDMATESIKHIPLNEKPSNEPAGNFPIYADQEYTTWMHEKDKKKDKKKHINEKPSNEPAWNFPIYADQEETTWMDEKDKKKDKKKDILPTDQISGIQMFEHWHASYHLWWEKRTKPRTTITD